MIKQLGIITSLLFVFATALLWTSCSNNCCDYAPVCAESACPADCCVPCGEPSCKATCAPSCKTAGKCHYGPSCKVCCIDGITVSARNPQLCMLGDEYPLEFDTQACDDVCDVVVTAHIPAGVTFKRASPEPVVEGKKLTWHFGSMRRGECKPTKVWLKCECEGEQCACFCATAVPVRFCSLLCAKPILECHKCGPEEVCPGDEVLYTITVSNRGTCTAEDVIVTDNVPDGLEHASSLRTLCYKLGSLEPCQSKCINICFCAAKRGRVCNTVVASACNADSVSCQACTDITICKSEVTKIGPKEVNIGKNADYQITVANTGDKKLTEVTVTDTAPHGTAIVSANGATICENQAVWRLKELNPGEKVNFNISLYTCTPGCYTNTVHVNNCQGCCSCDEFTTRWKGRPALNLCMKETDDMICVGDPTSYNITVTNQGSEPDSNVLLVVRFPAEITPISTTGDVDGKIEGNTVTFGPYNNFSARQVLHYRVDARAKASGDGRVVAELSSDSIQKPIVNEESTIVN